MHNNQTNYFTIFNLETNYSVNIKTLEKKYLKLQMQYHPDKITNPDHTKEETTSKSAILNQAYKTLFNPLSRAQYLLRCNDIDFDKIKDIPTITLEEAFTDRETLEDSSTSLVNLDKLLHISKESSGIYQTYIQKAFEENNLNKAINYIIHLKYKMKFITELEQKIKKIKRHGTN